jgi:hypothetical protein
VPGTIGKYGLVMSAESLKFAGSKSLSLIQVGVGDGTATEAEEAAVGSAEFDVSGVAVSGLLHAVAAIRQTARQMPKA